MDSGVLQCETLGSPGNGNVTFTADEVTYAVNGNARTRMEDRGWADILDISGDVQFLIDRGLELCD
jgi:hypothetical protein